MSSIVSVGTAVPPYLMCQDHARCMAEAHFDGSIENIERYVAVFKNALVNERYFCVEPEWFSQDHSLEAKNRLYLEWAEKLSIEAIEACLADTDVDREDIDHIVFVSSSGIATPSLDVKLINRLGLRADMRRLPLFGLGCAGGAAGIALGASLASTSATVLLVTVEINSLTFQADDLRKSNLVATSLFGDGAAAVLLRPGGEGPINVLNSVSLLKRETDHLMGWEFVDTGFRVVFSRTVPETIVSMMPETLNGVMNGRNIGMDDISAFIFHPGGKRILEAYEKVLARPREDFTSSYDVLSRYGNMSSATVLFVLNDILQRDVYGAGDYGLLAAFGPGFSAEATLVQWA